MVPLTAGRIKPIFFGGRGGLIHGKSFLTPHQFPMTAAPRQPVASSCRKGPSDPVTDSVLAGHARAVTRSRFNSADKKTNNANVAHPAAKEKVAQAPIIDQSIPPIIEADTRPMLMMVCRRP